MSRSHKDGHGRCGVCGDKAENCGRRQRERQYASQDLVDGVYEHESEREECE